MTMRPQGKLKGIFICAAFLTTDDANNGNTRHLVPGCTGMDEEEIFLVLFSMGQWHSYGWRSFSILSRLAKM